VKTTAWEVDGPVTETVEAAQGVSVDSTTIELRSDGKTFVLTVSGLHPLETRDVINAMRASTQFLMKCVGATVPVETISEAPETVQ
jgi:hypothetical protein